MHPSEAGSTATATTPRANPLVWAGEATMACLGWSQCRCLLLPQNRQPNPRTPMCSNMVP